MELERHWKHLNIRVGLNLSLIIRYEIAPLLYRIAFSHSIFLIKGERVK